MKENHEPADARLRETEAPSEPIGPLTQRAWVKPAVKCISMSETSSSFINSGSDSPIYS